MRRNVASVIQLLQKKDLNEGIWPSCIYNLGLRNEISMELRGIEGYQLSTLVQFHSKYNRNQLATLQNKQKPLTI